MTSTMLVTGGTGTLGRELVPRLRMAGVQVRVMSRHGCDARADLASGVGLAEAVEGCDTIVHLATGVRRLYGAIGAVDVLGTQRLMRIAETCNVQHVVYISIVGVDRIPFAYYRAKREAERTIEQQTRVGWSILRTTQFHNLVDLYFRALRWLPALVVPSATFCQPVDVAEVSDRLCSVVLAGPCGRLADFGGPQILSADELARAWLAATGRRRHIVQVSLAGRVAAGFRAGYHTTPCNSDGQVTWHEWLAHTYQRRSP